MKSLGTTLGAVALSLGIVAALAVAPARAVTLTGPTGNAGSYSTSDLQTQYGSSLNLVSFNGVQGVKLWDLLGGASPPSNVQKTPGTPWGAISTSSPSGTSSNNAILRDYVLATGANGERSVVSLGEIVDTFGNSPIFVAFQTTGGALLSTPELVAPTVAGAARGIDNLSSLQLLSVSAQGGPGGQSTNVVLTGDALKNPVTYSQSELQNLGGTILEEKQVQVMAGNVYSGLSLWELIKLNLDDPDDIMDKLVVIKGTDGYQVVHSLAEIVDADNSDIPNILLAYDDTGSELNSGSADIARTILLGDDPNRHGRWMSQLSEIEVISAPTATPLPASWTMMLLGLGALGIAKRRHAKKQVAARECAGA